MMAFSCHNTLALMPRTLDDLEIWSWCGCLELYAKRVASTANSHATQGQSAQKSAKVNAFILSIATSCRFSMISRL